MHTFHSHPSSVTVNTGECENIENRLSIWYLQYWYWWNTNTEIRNTTITATKASGIQCCIHHLNLWKTSSHGSDIMYVFLCVCMNSLSSGMKDVGSVEDDGVCQWYPCPLLPNGKFRFGMGIRCFVFAPALPISMRLRSPACDNM